MPDEGGPALPPRGAFSPTPVPRTRQELESQFATRKLVRDDYIRLTARAQRDQQAGLLNREGTEPPVQTDPSNEQAPSNRQYHAGLTRHLRPSYSYRYSSLGARGPIDSFIAPPFPERPERIPSGNSPVPETRPMPSIEQVPADQRVSGPQQFGIVQTNVAGQRGESIIAGGSMGPVLPGVFERSSSSIPLLEGRHDRVPPPYTSNTPAIREFKQPTNNSETMAFWVTHCVKLKDSSTAKKRAVSVLVCVFLMLLY